MPVLIYPSGRRPGACRNGHPWTGGTILVGNHPCDCPAALAHFRRHVYVRCDPPGGRCGELWFDPPCGKPPKQPPRA